MPAEDFPNALQKLREKEIFVVAFYWKTAENGKFLVLCCDLVILAKAILRTDIIYQGYIYFHDQNVIIYVIHKSMFCNSQITPYMDHYHKGYT